MASAIWLRFPRGWCPSLKSLTLRGLLLRRSAVGGHGSPGFNHTAPVAPEQSDCHRESDEEQRRTDQDEDRVDEYRHEDVARIGLNPTAHVPENPRLVPLRVEPNRV